MARSALPRADLDGDGSPWRGFEVPTIDGGKTKVKVPEGRIRAAVPPRRQGHAGAASREAGDMYVQVLVETPQKLTKPRRSCSPIRQAVLGRNATRAAGSSPKSKTSSTAGSRQARLIGPGHRRLDPVGTAATPLLQKCHKPGAFLDAEPDT